MGERGPAELEQAWRQDSRKVLATLICLLRDFDLAEEALHDAFLVAARQWPEQGLPANPSAWLVSAGRFRALDKLRRKSRFATVQNALLLQQEEPPGDDLVLEDDRLRLIFICCHPALSPEAQVALTLREVCGLTTEETARAFLTRTPAMAQRIVRAKSRIKEAELLYKVPERHELERRLDAVLRVIYLVSTRAIQPMQGTGWRGSISPMKRSGWPASCSSCCLSRRSWGCSD